MKQIIISFCVILCGCHSTSNLKQEVNLQKNIGANHIYYDLDQRLVLDGNAHIKIKDLIVSADKISVELQEKIYRELFAEGDARVSNKAGEVMNGSKITIDFTGAEPNFKVQQKCKCYGCFEKE